MDKILKLLERDCKLTTEQLAAMCAMSEEEITAAIAKYEADNIILGYKALVDWERAIQETVTALIEVQVTPQRDEGFDRIARRIYQYEEVESMYLMSGGYDFTVIVTGRSLKEVSQFVTLKLSTIEGVKGTATHFILKRYKEKHALFTPVEGDQEERMIFV